MISTFVLATSIVKAASSITAEPESEQDWFGGQLHCVESVLSAQMTFAMGAEFGAESIFGCWLHPSRFLMFPAVGAPVSSPNTKFFQAGYCETGGCWFASTPHGNGVFPGIREFGGRAE